MFLKSAFSRPLGSKYATKGLFFNFTEVSVKPFSATDWCEACKPTLIQFLFCIPHSLQNLYLWQHCNFGIGYSMRKNNVTGKFAIAVQ